MTTFVESDTWETVKDFEDYEIHRMYPYEIRRKDDGHIMSERVSGYKKYVKINLRRNKIRYTCLKHIIVAKQWIPNPDNLPEVDHIDHDPTNFRVENLRWVTRSENMYNLPKANGIEYTFINELPETAEPLEKYNDYILADIFIDRENEKLYKKTGPSIYRECVAYKPPKGCDRYTAVSVDGKKISMGHTQLFNHTE